MTPQDLCGVVLRVLGEAAANFASDHSAQLAETSLDSVSALRYVLCEGKATLQKGSA